MRIVSESGEVAFRHAITHPSLLRACETGSGFVHSALFLQLFPVERDAFAHVNEQILKIRGFLRLAAHSLYRPTLVLCRFLTLKTKRVFFSVTFRALPFSLFAALAFPRQKRKPSFYGGFRLRSGASSGIRDCHISMRCPSGSKT